jgi:hypothetical protein
MPAVCAISVWTGSAADLASNPMGTGALSAGVKRPGREADHASLLPHMYS